MASERIRIEGEQIYREPLPAPATHVTLPLDPAQLDDAALEAAAISIRKSLNFVGEWARVPQQYRYAWMNDARAALAAYANHVAGGAR
jgi:hypothetical protein